MGSHPAKLPAYAPEQNPIRLRCEGWRTYGWLYRDGTVELICREKRCKRPGYETRHLINPTNGSSVTVYVPLPEPRS